MFGNPSQLGSWVEIGLIVGAFLSGIVFTWFPKLRAKNKKQKRRQAIGLRFETLHTRIHEQLTQLRVTCDCARTWVAAFHNGESFFDGTPIRKWSITHESVHLGIRNSIEETQNVLATKFPELIQFLHGSPTLQMTVHLEDGHSMKPYMQSRNVSGFILVPIMDAKGIDLYGFICCEWSSLAHLDRIDAELEWKILNQLKESRNVIQGLQINGTSSYK